MIGIWTGGTDDGNYATAANWIDDATGTAPASPPGNGDDIIFDRGSKDLTGGLSPSATLAKIVGTNGYTGRIAPSAVFAPTSAASIEWSAGSINFSGNVAGFAKFAARTGTKVNVSGGTLAQLVASRCTMTIQAAAVVTRLWADTSDIDIMDNATDMTECFVRGPSIVKSYRDGVYDIGAQSRLDALLGCQLNSGTVVQDNGMLIYKSSEDITDITVGKSATFDASDSSTVFTLTTLNRWMGANVNLQTKSGPVTPGTENIYGVGGYSFSSKVPL